MRKEIKIAFDVQDIENLDRQAKAAGVSRAEVVRSKTLASNSGRQYTPQEYQRLVSRVCRGVDMPRSQVERLVNIVFIELMAPRGEEASLG